MIIKPLLGKLHHLILFNFVTVNVFDKHTVTADRKDQIYYKSRVWLMETLITVMVTSNETELNLC